MGRLGDGDGAVHSAVEVAVVLAGAPGENDGDADLVASRQELGAGDAPDLELVDALSLLTMSKDTGPALAVSFWGWKSLLTAFTVMSPASGLAASANPSDATNPMATMTTVRPMPAKASGATRALRRVPATPPCPTPARPAS